MSAYTDRFSELCDAMDYSEDTQKAKTFREVESWAFGQISLTNPGLAQEWLERLEPIDWNNYISEDEEKQIAPTLGKDGLLLTASDVEAAAAACAGRTEHRPYFNTGALTATMRLLASEFSECLRQFVGADDLPKVLYKMAVEKLSDPDHPGFIRARFGL